MITLAEVSALGHALLSAEKSVTEAERKLKEAKEVARALREESLPSAMQELGLSAFSLDSGEKVSIKQDVFVSISQEKREEALAWLEAHGFGGLIKSDVELHFGKAELKKMESAVELLESGGFDPEVSRSVHPMTLKAFVREQLEAGTADFPLELFGARPVFTATIK